MKNKNFNTPYEKERAEDMRKIHNYEYKKRKEEKQINNFNTDKKSQ